MRLVRWIARWPVRVVSWFIAALFSQDLTPGEVIDNDERPSRERG